MGQHTIAAKRYPHTAKFNIFSQDSIPDKNWITKKDKQYIAEYDNATLYNDYVVHEIIDKFRNDTAIILYFPDHGEEIYDFRNQAGRTQEKVKTSNILKYQYEIPFVIWCSNKYMEKYPEVTNSIKNAISKPFMNDNICQILFGIAGIQTPYYHSTRDLLSPLYRPYKYRKIQDNTIYEKNRLITN
jgi:heptose-I-phosphate ethanolaminephosphotransferase